MAEVHLKMPLKEDDVRKLKLGDTVYLSGTIYTGRDEVHVHALAYEKEGKKLPVDFRNTALFHCGPIMRKVNGGWTLVAAGPTTSSRMNDLEPQFIEKFGIRAVIGKGGMSRPTVEAMKKFGCVYLSMTGGAAVLAAKGVEKVHGVHWLELGMPEAIWILEAKNFGPLTVGIDANGNSLFEKVDFNVRKNVEAIKRRLGLS